jgi:4'-phosphopantetheinyl transferase
MIYLHKIGAHHSINLMPLLKIHTLGKQRAWAVWHITEKEQELSNNATEYCPTEVINTLKRLEWLASRALTKGLMESMGCEYHGIGKNEFGKPFLKNNPHHISLSHSYPYVLAQVDIAHDVGVDLEQPKEKLRTVASRVFTKTEVDDAANDLVKLCIYWCAKEALYKVHGRKNILFTDHLKVESFRLATTGTLVGRIIHHSKETIVHLQYLVEMEYVLVYTSLQNLAK